MRKDGQILLAHKCAGLADTTMRNYSGKNYEELLRNEIT
jgi:hypothetical protein